MLYTDCVGLLLKNSADVNAIDRRNSTILHWAVKAYRTSMVKIFLVVKYIDVNKKDKDGDTPIHRSVMNGDQGMI